VHRTWRATVALGAAIAFLLSGCSTDKSDKAKNSGTAEITTNGGNFTVGDIAFNVVPKTVEKTTKLTVSAPTVQKGATPRPLGTATSTNVQFDISLAGGAQPLEPLDVQIPLNGAFLPAGAKPENARIYTPSDDGWRLVPSVVKNGVLHTKLAHLSPKNISFALPGEIWDSINPWKPQEVKNCNRELTTTATGKVTLGGDGWKKDTSSVLHPCLVQENGKAMLRVGNNAGIMWSVASNGPSINSPDGSVEIGMVKLIAKTLAPNNKVKAYLAEGDATWTKIDQGNLPVTLEFKADPSTFLSQALWVGLNMSVGMFTGTSGSKTVAYVKNLLELADVVGCLNNAAETATGNFDANKIVDVMFSTCGEMIAKSLGVDVKSGESADWGLGGILAALGGVKDSIGLLSTAFQGVMQQVNGNVTVKVTRAAPPCATLAGFKQALRKFNVVVTGVRKVECSNGWAQGSTTTGDGGPYDFTFVLIRHVNGKWVHARTMNEPIFYGTPETDKLCAELPADFRKGLCVHL